jgi:putative sigma-54 modulation protein
MNRPSSRKEGVGLQVEISSRHGAIAPDIKDYAHKKAQRLLKYYNRIQSIRVVLDREGGSPSCEMIANLEHTHDLVGRAADKEIRAAIDSAVDRLERQLVAHKDRTRHRKGRGPHPHQPTRTG